MNADNMTMNELHEYIMELFDLLEDHNIDTTKFEDRWNFITDIDTNKIRLEGYEEAVGLAQEMELVYQKLFIK